MNQLCAGLSTLALLALVSCSDDNGQPGQPNFGSDEKIADVCSGKIQTQLTSVGSITLPPLDLSAGTSAPWGEGHGGYSIRVGEGDVHYRLQASADSVACKQVYDSFDPTTRLHTGEDRLYNTGEFYFNVKPQLYHEANGTVFADMASLSAEDKVDETVNVSLDQLYDAGDLTRQLMFVGVDPSDTNDSPLDGSRIAPTEENTNIIGSFDRITLDCTETFKVKPVLVSGELSSVELNPDYCADRTILGESDNVDDLHRYCVHLRVEPPSEGTECSFSATVRINTQQPDMLIPPMISGDVVRARVLGRLERLANVDTSESSNDPQFHLWDLSIDKIGIIAE